MLPEQKTLIVNITDKSFKIKIDPQNETQFLEIIKKVNAKIKEFKTDYPGLYLQEYLSMIIIWLALENITQTNDEQKQTEENFMKTLLHWANNIPDKNA